MAASSNVIVLTKSPTEVAPYEFDVSLNLLTGSGEIVTSVTVGLVSPSGGMLALSPYVVNSTTAGVTLSGGAEGVTYGVRLDIGTNLPRVFPITLAVLVSSYIGETYTVRNPDATQTLIDSITAGDSALGNGTFTFPQGTNISNGYIVWELLDTNGYTYSSGNAFEYVITNTNLAVRAEGRAVITIPSDVPVNLDGYKYQIRWTLTLPSGQTYFNYENVRVTSPNTVPQGPEDSVELAGDTGKLSVVLPGVYDNVGAEIYQLSGSLLLVAYSEAMEKQKTPDGYYCSLYVDTTLLPVALENYIVRWKYWNNSSPNTIYSQVGRLFVVNANIMSATTDMQSFINKSRATIAHQEDMLFPVPYLLVFLRRGRDAFNAAYGILTQFNMTDATSGIRQFWLWFAEVEALRAQFIAEGEKAFNFSGQAISLDIDRTGYYESAASSMQSRLDNECKSFKQNLIKKGIVSGTGNMDSIALRIGAIGSVGISISPASNWGRFMGKFGSGGPSTGN